MTTTVEPPGKRMRCAKPGCTNKLFDAYLYSGNIIRVKCHKCGHTCMTTRIDLPARTPVPVPV